jgi:hypothetical protein
VRSCASRVHVCVSSKLFNGDLSKHSVCFTGRAGCSVLSRVMHVKCCTQQQRHTLMTPAGRVTALTEAYSASLVDCPAACCSLRTLLQVGLCMQSSAHAPQSVWSVGALDVAYTEATTHCAGLPASCPAFHCVCCHRLCPSALQCACQYASAPFSELV